MLKEGGRTRAIIWAAADTIFNPAVCTSGRLLAASDSALKGVMGEGYAKELSFIDFSIVEMEPLIMSARALSSVMAS